MLKLWMVFGIFLCTLCFAAADIAFLSDRDGKSNIYVMNDDGSDVRRLTDMPLKVGELVWSSDGHRLAFSMDLNSGEPGNPQGLPQQYDIFIMNADGTRQRNLTKHPSQDGGPALSPDGKSLAFISGREGHSTLDIYVMDMITGKVWQLTRLGFATSPAWSPDGKKIAYEFAKAGEGRHIYTMNADGQNPRPLLRQPRKGQFGNTNVISLFPSWSPNGKYILYNEVEFGAKGRVANTILVVANDTRHISVLDTPKNWLIDKVCWADGGGAVLFAAVPGGLQRVVPKIFKIYKYELATGRITNLTDHPSDNWGMDWTPHLSLSVSSRGKLTTQWAEIKRDPE